ncbi:hypothetical protein SODALDRAFT_353430 [Sodiomyces alkalinus F11]|uniref:Alpha/beta-hydrolase n=1 Tax=Sodiomyces alkalinus (strain CBS 110278 / VKM F-3762 / F11) TaxID=1314773 RepID=A0A3N2PKF7_SODAK|nr:hypothetical protein SODALDRAFT_353430 [Sodiomyces alkalinus F11]ROT35003.1 hypothetical protein SODALDRAFT_353430 [Sodiomyces alkalinus F11]
MVSMSRITTRPASFPQTLHTIFRTNASPLLISRVVPSSYILIGNPYSFKSLSNVAVPRRPCARGPGSRPRLAGLPLMSRRDLHSQMFWLPPLMFVGLLGALWIWKCAMMIVFQNKIIYMPGLPPNARRERIQDYARECGGVVWEERRTRAADGTDLALCVASVESTGPKTSTSPGASASGIIPVYILYFQGNASSIPPRLQDLSAVLRTLQRGKQRARYTMICLSYRGYWTSRGRPSERGINLDAQAGLEYVTRLHDEQEQQQSADNGPNPRPVLIFWGQSIGSGVATNLAAAWEDFPRTIRLDGLVLETAFTSVKDMLGALYPSKWTPYRYLWPFLRNHLDSLANLDQIARLRSDDGGPPHITLVVAGQDELVPADHGARLEQRGRELGLTVERKIIRGTFHNDVMFRGEGRKAVADSIEKVVVATSRDGTNNGS